MINSFMIVGEQIIIVFALIVVGFICGKLKIINNNISKGLSSIAVNLTIPATILMSFHREFDAVLLKDFLFSVGIGILMYLICIVLSTLTIKEKSEKRRNVIKCAVIFSNCAMMAMPLESALLGSDGVFFGAAHAGLFNLVFWTYGLYIISGSNGSLNFKKALLTPCIICTFAGMIMFLFNISLPQTTYKILEHLSNMTLPLSMMIIGYTISSTNIGDVLSDKWCWLAALERLIIVPMILLGLLLLFRKTGTAAVTAVISIASPAAASINILAVLYGKDEKLAAGLVSVSTILSLLTLPVITALAQNLLG
ncbi:MAG: AEC family transporter [Eubacteriales bacterium]|nr:AEC family transporter [Eubacteriales bacterium]